MKPAAPKSRCILIIDEEPVANALDAYFANQGIPICQQHDLQALIAATNLPQALLIAWPLLKDHPALIHALHLNYAMPLFILVDGEIDAITPLALEAGADNVLVKPLNPRELHAHITAVNRRINSKDWTICTKDAIIFASWILYPASRQLFNIHRQEIALSVSEYALLMHFIAHPNQVLSRDALVQISKNHSFNPLDRRIDIQISRLRQKLEPNPRQPSLIKTVRYDGYLFTPQLFLLQGGRLSCA